MLEDAGFFSLNFLAYGGIQTGDHRGMRYRLIREGEKPDFHLTAWVWPEPFSFEATAEEKKTAGTFPFTEEGRIQAIRWIQKEYEERLEEWAHAPSLLTAER